MKFILRRLKISLLSILRNIYVYSLFQGTVGRLIGRALLAVDYISDNLSKEQLLPLLSVIATLLLIGAAGYGMSYLL